VRNGIEEGDKILTGFIRPIRFLVACTKPAREATSELHATHYHLAPFFPDAAVADILGEADKVVVELVA
jgi:hypothetical protein